MSREKELEVRTVADALRLANLPAEVVLRLNLSPWPEIHADVIVAARRARGVLGHIKSLNLADFVAELYSGHNWATLSQALEELEAFDVWHALWSMRPLPSALSRRIKETEIHPAVSAILPSYFMGGLPEKAARWLSATAPLQ